MIRPTQANADGTLSVICEQCAAGSQVKTLAIGQITFGTISAVIVLTCPTCGSSSSHPVQGDGSCRAAVQDLFARTIQRLGSPDGKIAAGNYAAAQAAVAAQLLALAAPP